MSPSTAAPYAETRFWTAIGGSVTVPLLGQHPARSLRNRSPTSPAPSASPTQNTARGDEQAT
jgi:hypothetical protein